MSSCGSLKKPDVGLPKAKRWHRRRISVTRSLVVVMSSIFGDLHNCLIPHSIARNYLCLRFLLSHPMHSRSIVPMNMCSAALGHLSWARSYSPARTPFPAMQTSQHPCHLLPSKYGPVLPKANNRARLLIRTAPIRRVQERIGSLLHSVTEAAHTSLHTSRVSLLSHLHLIYSTSRSTLAPRVSTWITPPPLMLPVTSSRRRS
ncbi:uncharacterized protein HD556DRAFT_1327764 [Suillus plorans]|uniref:Uncharacterized protein n=1 Tax=Suillus plorans TaxID=116603 RepID=A0A9P7DWG7_9AGAM|nr:uncharacterized protein HD556DRAFT_1327764 [Suillus plorans]KAG1804991.1 hypothetical protein HD556DRAFT_1327764 [Suillus plorans]